MVLIVLVLVLEVKHIVLVKVVVGSFPECHRQANFLWFHFPLFLHKPSLEEDFSEASSDLLFEVLNNLESVACRGAGGERGDGPGHPRQGGIQGVKITKI